MKCLKRYDYHSINFVLLITVYLLGAISVYLISVLQDSDENMYQKQILGLVLGLVIIAVVALFDYHFICKFFIPIYLFGVGLLLVCRFVSSGPIYGWAHFDARRWIKIGGDPTAGINNTGFEFQPSEIMKIALIIFIAKYFDLCYKKIKKIWVLLLAILFMAIPTLLIATQTDLSTSILFALFFAAMVFASGVPFKYIIPIIAVLTPLIIALVWYVQQPFQVILKDYQQKRVLAAIHPELYPELTYQQTNAAAAIRSGGLFGKLFTGDTGPRGTRFVPVKESDFIFTAVAEEFGFIGSVVILVLYFIVILMAVRIARRAKDYLGRLIALGIASLIAFQVFINIGVVTSLLPNTGIPLPFMSAGLSSLLINLVMIGILINISMQPAEREEKKKEDEFEFLNVN